ncbi:hypothetical protein NBRC116494_36420 [Aurantivibrio plasticivorans]
MNWLAVALGGALGAMARYGVVAYIVPIPSNRFPLGTLLANYLGCFVIGAVYVTIMEKNLLGDQWRPFIITGFLGALTTFSAFALETVQLWQAGHTGIALAYVVCSFVGCILLTWLALNLTHQFI